MVSSAILAEPVAHPDEPAVGGRREERAAWLWLAIAVYTRIVLVTAYFAQFALDALRAGNALAETVVAAFVLVAVVLAVVVVLRRPGIGELVLVVVGARAYLLVFSALHIVQERIHLIQYGLLGALAYAAFENHWSGDRQSSVRPVVAALLLTTAIGWIDEGIQHLLPHRVYDSRDVALNAISGALAIGLVAGRQRLRRGVAAGPGGHGAGDH